MTTTSHPTNSQTHLLAPSSFTLPDPSLRSNRSRPASILSTSSIDTLIAPAPTTSLQNQTRQTPQNSYKGFPTQEAYLAALRDWVETKMYFEPTQTRQLTGFYGSRTMRDYVSTKNDKMKSVVEEIEENSARPEVRRIESRTDKSSRKEGKRRSLKKMLGGRRATVG